MKTTASISLRVVRDPYLGDPENLSTGLVPKVLFIALGQEQELPPLRVEIRGAADHQQHDPTRKPGYRHNEAESPLGAVPRFIGTHQPDSRSGFLNENIAFSLAINTSTSRLSGSAGDSATP